MKRPSHRGTLLCTWGLMKPYFTPVQCVREHSQPFNFLENICKLTIVRLILVHALFATIFSSTDVNFKLISGLSTQLPFACDVVFVVKISPTISNPHMHLITPLALLNQLPATCVEDISPRIPSIISTLDTNMRLTKQTRQGKADNYDAMKFPQYDGNYSLKAAV